MNPAELESKMAPHIFVSILLRASVQNNQFVIIIGDKTRARPLNRNNTVHQHQTCMFEN